jgi:hypothetical protein
MYEFLDSGSNIGDERFQTPRTLQSFGRSVKSNRILSNTSPRSIHSDEWKTASSSRSIPITTTTLSDNGDYKTPRSKSSLTMNREDSFHSTFSRRDLNKKSNRKESAILSEISEYESVDNKDITEVFSYARHGRCEDIIRSINIGLPVDVRDDSGNTMLVIACQNGNKRVAKLLLRKGANVDVRNYKGNTPLHYCYHCKLTFKIIIVLSFHEICILVGYGSTLGEYLIAKVYESFCKMYPSIHIKYDIGS